MQLEQGLLKLFSEGGFGGHSAVAIDCLVVVKDAGDKGADGGLLNRGRDGCLCVASLEPVAIPSP